MNLEETIKPEILFLILGLVFGLMFLLVTPPFLVGDEGTHFFKAYDISEGHLFPNKINNYFPKSIVKCMDEFTYLQIYPDDRVNINDAINLLSLHLSPDNKISIDISHVVIYPPIPYLASASVMVICKFFNLSPLIMLYFGRLINLLIWIILVYFAIRITPIHKWVFLLLALMPRTLFQAASLSVDSLSFGLSFLVIALFLNYSVNENKKIHLKEVFVLVLVILALILSKQGYALLILLFFMIPISKFKNNKLRVITFVLISLPSIIIAGIWDMLFKKLYIPHAMDSISIPGQISFILADPLNFLFVLLNTLILQSKFYLRTFISGWFESSLLDITIIVYIAMLFFVSFIDKSKFKLNSKQKSISLLIFSIIFILAFLFEYISYTAVGKSYILGVQGRYFIPIAPLFFLLFYNSKITEIINNKINLNPNKFYLFNIAFIILILSISISLLFSRFYI